MSEETKPVILTVDRDARWQEIQRISDRVARQDDAPTETESALCGAVWRAMEWMRDRDEAIEALRKVLESDIHRKDARALLARLSDKPEQEQRK